MTKNGFNFTGTVRETGEAAFRGGIVDIFPAGSIKPVRLDLFGEKIEKIKHFNPVDQKSMEEVNSFTIHPVREFILDSNSVSQFRSKYRQMFSNVTEGEILTFKYYSSLDDEIINYGENVEFTANMIVGNGFSTFSLSRETAIPTMFSLEAAYPNPFNPVTTLGFAIPKDTEVSISVYNLQGREVISLVDNNMQAGYHSVVWNAEAQSSGVYFIKMVAGEYASTQKLILVK